MSVFKKKEKEKTAEEWFTLGNEEDDPDKQLEYYTKALDINPKFVLIWNIKGQALDNLDRYDEAIACYDKAQEIDPKNATSWNLKGIALTSLGRRDEARACFGKALRIDPDYDSAKNNFKTLIGELTTEERYELLREAVDRDAVEHITAEEWFDKGSDLYEMGRYDEAIACLDKVLDIYPENTEVWHNKGITLSGLGRHDEAIACFDKALEIDPSNELARNSREESKSELHEEGATNEETIRKQISTFNSEIDHLAKDRVEKFSEAGEIAYSECIENMPELAPDAQTELDNILAIDTLISKTNQEMEKAKSGKKKTGFLGKLGGAVSSVAKQGKLKVELYNLERKKKSAITDFGEALWESHKSEDDTLQELSDIWHAIEDMEQQIHENEEEIDNLNELLR